MLKSALIKCIFFGISCVLTYVVTNVYCFCSWRRKRCRWWRRELKEAQKFDPQLQVIQLQMFELPNNNCKDQVLPQVFYLICLKSKTVVFCFRSKTVVFCFVFCYLFCNLKLKLFISELSFFLLMLKLRFL